MANKGTEQWKDTLCRFCGVKFHYNLAWASVPTRCNACVLKDRIKSLRHVDFAGIHNYLIRLIKTKPHETELIALLGKPSKFILSTNQPDVFDELSLIRQQLHDIILKASTRDQLIEMVSNDKKVAKLCLSVQTVFDAEEKVAGGKDNPWNAINSTKPMPGGAPGSRR